jgi:hypothetical protein
MENRVKQSESNSGVTRRAFIERTLSSAAGSYLLLKTSKTAAAVAAAAPVSEEPGVPAGISYEATVPDTLDLAERARLALRCLTGTLDPVDRDGVQYEIYFHVNFNASPAWMAHEGTGLPTINPKFAESLPMMRVMSGSDHNLDVENGMMKSMLRFIEPPGLYYAHHTKLRTWDQTWNPADRDFANVYGNSRMVLGMMAWYQRDQNPEWKQKINAMVEGLLNVAIDRGDYAYYPDDRVGEAFSYPLGGWHSTKESDNVNWIHMYHSGTPRAAAAWYLMNGNPKALELSRKITNYMTQSKMWGNIDEPRFIESTDLAHWGGHFHGHVMMLRGILSYATAVNDGNLKDFVRNGYEFARTYGVPTLGWFPETTHFDHRPCESCCIADMVGLAASLSTAGVGDYWDDVDMYVRNQLVEQQVINPDLLQAVSEHSMAATIDSPRQTSDQVIQRNIGGFVGFGNLAELPKTWIMHCCTGNSTQALYYAWEATTRYQNGSAVVNLLLNRASPWLDIDSYLPYEGKVVIRNKTSEQVSVRIPQWVNRDALNCRIGERKIPTVWVGNYLLVKNLSPRDEITLTFPVPRRTLKFDWYGQTYTAELKGSTVVNLSPRQSPLDSYPIYVRDFYNKDTAPMKKVSRYVTERLIYPNA